MPGRVSGAEVLQPQRTIIESFRACQNAFNKKVSRVLWQWVISRVTRENDSLKKAYHVFSEIGGNLSWDVADLRIHDVVDTDRIAIILIVRIPFGGNMLPGSGNAIVEADSDDFGVQSA